MFNLLAQMQALGPMYQQMMQNGNNQQSIGNMRFMGRTVPIPNMQQFDLSQLASLMQLFNGQGGFMPPEQEGPQPQARRYRYTYPANPYDPNSGLLGAGIFGPKTG